MTKDLIFKNRVIVTLYAAAMGKKGVSKLPDNIGILPRGTLKLFKPKSRWYFQNTTWTTGSDFSAEIVIVDENNEHHYFPWSVNDRGVMAKNAVIILSRIIRSEMPYLGITYETLDIFKSKYLELLIAGLVIDNPRHMQPDMITNAATIQSLIAFSPLVSDADVDIMLRLVTQAMSRLEFDPMKPNQLNPILIPKYEKILAKNTSKSYLFEHVTLNQAFNEYVAVFSEKDEGKALSFLSVAKMEKGGKLEIKTLVTEKPVIHHSNVEGYTYSLPSLDQLPEPKEDVAVVSEAAASRLKEMGFNSCDGQTIDHSKFTNLHNLYDEQPNKIPEMTKLTTMEKVINYIVEFKDPLYPTYVNHFTAEFYAHMLFCVNEPLVQEILNPKCQDEEGQFNKLFIAMTGEYLDELKEGKIGLDIISVFLSERDEYLGKFFDALRSLTDDTHLFARRRTMLSRESARSTRNRERSSAIYPRGLEREEDREKFSRGTRFSR